MIRSIVTTSTTHASTLAHDVLLYLKDDKTFGIISQSLNQGNLSACYGDFLALVACHAPAVIRAIVPIALIQAIETFTHQMGRRVSRAQERADILQQRPLRNRTADARVKSFGKRIHQA